MKKHELLKYAYDNYKKDVRFITLLEKLTCRSSGVFELNEDDYNAISDVNTGQYIYEYGRWATIVPEAKPSILSGKCAIQVNNEREFKLLMEHYASKGWVPCPIQIDKNDFGTTHHIIEYSNPFLRMDESNIIATNQYTIIPFSDFATEVGITVPVFVMTSEDGVPLYEGDGYYRACDIGSKGKWQLITIGGSDPTSGKLTASHRMSFSDNERIFSTKEAAEKWCKEQNKPKSIMVSEFSQYPVEVTAKKFTIKCGNSDNHLDNLVIHSDELEEIYKAYKSLQ